MPTMTNRPPVAPSALTPGRHPGYLLQIVEEPTPEGWPMAEKSPTLYRWFFALWEVPTLVDRQAPELQTGITSTKFAPKGKFQASKAFTWTSQILNKTIAPGESVNLDPMLPLPCSVKVSRDPGKDFVKIEDVEAWPEGAALLTEPMKQALKDVLAHPPEPPPVAAPPAPPPTPTPQPGLQTWGGQAATAPASTSRPTF